MNLNLFNSPSKAKQVLYRRFLFYCLIFLIIFFAYRFSNYSHVLEGGDHFVYLASSILKGQFSVDDIPFYYRDVVEFSGHKFLPFPPMPAFILLPFAAVWGTEVTQLPISGLIGAMTVVLFWVLLERLRVQFFSRVCLTTFFAFGTVFWFATVTATAWFFAHIVGVFFLILALVEFFGNRRVFLVGLFIGFSGLARPTMFLSLIFFLFLLVYDLKKSKTSLNSSSLRPLGYLLLGFLGPAIFFLFYNYVRFDNIFNSGYNLAYDYYVNNNIIYSEFRDVVPSEFPHFGLYDFRNIPLHIYTMFFAPPLKLRAQFPFLFPSTFGTGILFTSPLLLAAFREKISQGLIWAAWIAIGFIFFAVSLYYAQGWAQFGYRFLLDFLPFWMLILALHFKNQFGIWSRILLIYSILITFWGIFLWHHLR